MATLESTGIRTAIMILKGKNMDSGLMKEVIRDRWDRTVQKYAILPGHGFISEEEKEAWKNLLPMGQKKRPEADIELLKDLGFHVDLMDVKIPRTARTKTVLGYLKYGRRDDRRNFMLMGAKTGVKEE